MQTSVRIICRVQVVVSAAAAALLVACGSRGADAGRAPDSVVTIDPNPTVTVASTAPATYAGTLPCADCGGIVTTLTLWPDTVYRLREVYEGKQRQPSVSMGRWRVDAGILSLETDSGMPRLYSRVGDDTLTLLDLQGKPIASALNVALVRAAAMDSIGEVVEYTGTFMNEGEAPMFRECGSGQTYPVLRQGDYPALKRALTAAKLPAGSGQQVIVRGRFMPRPAGTAGAQDRAVLRVEKYVGPAANPNCR
ncbi:MAG: copper resistance protein NlpE N-terminal domain-containing protein [Gemmatimonadaceae bacterium]|jgi:copper homeostasis protein (lipoprotein)